MTEQSGAPGVRVQPWTDERPPTEETILGVMAREGLRPYRWANGPGDVYGAHSHPYHKVILVVSGSITFGFPEAGTTTTLAAGDRLELSPGVAPDAGVGPHRGGWRGGSPSWPPGCWSPGC
jgi:quercetin dioxygenase-like cupin family protein